MNQHVWCEAVAQEIAGRAANYMAEHYGEKRAPKPTDGEVSELRDALAYWLKKLSRKA
jgi:hypothetical protein